MNDIIKKKASVWTKRFKECMSLRGYSQVSLAEALNTRYGTKFGQKDVSRWTNIGMKNRNGEIGFPKYETMLQIADFFNVDVGYLTGETNNQTFTLEEVCLFMGLSQSAIQSLRESIFPFGKYLDEDMASALNSFFSSGQISELCDAIRDLHGKTTLLSQLKESYIPEFKCEEAKDQWFDIYADNHLKLSEVIKIARYHAHEAFTLLINEAFDINSSS